MTTASASRFVSVLFGVVFIAGCTSVTSRKLVGETPVTLDAKLWNGTWTDDAEAVIYLRVKDATNGVLEAATVELSDTELKFNKFEVRVRQSGAWLWANFKDEGETGYTFVRLAEPDRHLLVWSPDPAAFVKRVKAGTLTGELLKDDQGKESGSVVLDELKAEHIRAIESGEWKDAFDLARPGILRRLGPAPEK